MTTVFSGPYRGVEHELMRRHIHGLHQFVRFFDNGGAVTPGKNGCKKTCYFNIG
jgi:hypothetical protein